MTRTLIAFAVLLVVSVAMTTGCDKPAATNLDPQLDRLVVAPDGPMTGYSRDRFQHWITVSGTCDTRETVLKRDGSGVVTNSSCQATSGSWFSPYDGATWPDPGRIDIDHVVPLAEAWRTGAKSWTATKRKEFANDLTRPQLLAVTDKVNQGKGDKDPAQWLPTRKEAHCKYAADWTAVKWYYGLTVTAAEKNTLAGILRICGGKRHE